MKNELSEPLEGPAYLEVGAGGSSGREAILKNGLSEPLEGPAYLEVGAGGSSGREAKRTKGAGPKVVVSAPFGEERA